MVVRLMIMGGFDTSLMMQCSIGIINFFPLLPTYHLGGLFEDEPMKYALRISSDDPETMLITAQLAISAWLGWQGDKPPTAEQLV